MSKLSNITPEDIVRLRGAYEPLFAASKAQMQYVQSIVDGNYAVLKKPVPGLTEYHPTHPFGRLLKTIDRVAAIKPKLHIEPDGKGKQAKAIADKVEKQVQAWIYALPSATIMHPWRGHAHFNLLRGKSVGCGPVISDAFRTIVPKRKSNETEADYQMRIKRFSGRRISESVFTYIPIDPLEIIHPPTTRRTPPWVMRVGEIEVSQVKESYPFWSDPMMKSGRREGNYVSMTAFVSPYQIALLADGEPVSNRGTGKNGKTNGAILVNPYGRVYYDVLYSGRGYVTTAANATSLGAMSAEAQAASETTYRASPTTPEERLAVGLLDSNIEDFLLQAVVVTAARVYAGRWAKQIFTGGMSAEDFDVAMKQELPYFKVERDQAEVKVMPQPPFPAEILRDLFGIGGDNIELNTMPNIGMGVHVPGITSGYQTRTTQAPIDLQSVALRESIEHVIEDTARECIYAAKHVMTVAQASEACRYISRDDLPDALDIRVELAPPDEEARARRASLAEKIRDKLDDDTLREEFGFENNVEIRRKLQLDQLLLTQEARAAVTQLGLQKFGLLLQQQQAREAAAVLSSLPAPAPTNGAGLTPQVEGVPTQQIPGSPEEQAMHLQQQMAQEVPVPEGVMP